MSRLAFLLPGDPATLTGGYIYDRRIVAGLRDLGWDVRLHTLDPGFPDPSGAALDQARRVLEGIADGDLVLIDGLALGGMPDLAASASRRLRLVALIHHPLAMETGLSPARAKALRDAERRALAVVAGVVVTSRFTARLLGGYGVGPERIAVVEPGTDPAPLAHGSGGKRLNLLCVATLIPRKGHAVLLDALARLTDRDWHLACVGSLERSPDTAAAIRRRIEAAGLAARVSRVGEVEEAALAACYDRADLFVLPSLFEGYGMAIAEALARGLAVVASRAGAIPDTVPPGAGLLVPPGDAPALARALAQVMDDARLCTRLAAGARAARGRLPTWGQASQCMAAALARIGER